MEKTVVAVDAMGGDNAPVEVIKGVVDAVNQNSSVDIILTGPVDVITAELAKYTFPEGRITIEPASEVITTEEAPAIAVRRKKDASLVVAMKKIKTGDADAFVSAGSTGAIVVAGFGIAGRIRGIDRTPIGAIVPTVNGPCLIVDSGANVDCRSNWLVQFAQMGSIYVENALGIKNPRVGIVNIGAEAEKGNALVHETYPLLSACETINFTGSVEARDIPYGPADVIVCDGFVGNVVLKMYEGTASALLGLIKGTLKSSLRTKMGAAMILPALKDTLKTFDASNYGGAPLLGLNGLVVKAHGSSKAKEITTAILQCVTFKEQGINDKIRAVLGRDAKKAAEAAANASVQE